MRSTLACLTLLFAACAHAQTDPATTTTTTATTAAMATDTATVAQPAAPEPKVAITDTKLGTGTVARPGMTVEVHYTGWLYDPKARDGHGKEFDSSRKRGTPIKFPLGANRVIKGWEQGIAGLKVGGRRTLVIPSALGYGARDKGAIPPNSDLIFEVELVNAY
jgi:FKBP-type peptidyl-prolyl cis-trans isomerase FkpA